MATLPFRMQVRFHDDIDGSSLARAIYASTGPLLFPLIQGFSHTHTTLSYTTSSHKHNSVTHNFATRAWHFWHWAGSGGPGLVRIDAAMLEVHVTSPARQLEREATGFHGGLIGSKFWLHRTLSRNVVAHTAFSHTQRCPTHVIHKSATQHNPIVMQPITSSTTNQYFDMETVTIVKLVS